MTDTITYEIPNKIEARNFDELRALMFATNIRLGGKVIYDIHPPRSDKGKWYAFFYEKFSTAEIVDKQLKALKTKKGS